MFRSRDLDGSFWKRGWVCARAARSWRRRPGGHQRGLHCQTFSWSPPRCASRGKRQDLDSLCSAPTLFPAHGEAESQLVEKGREERGGEQGGGAASPTNHLVSPHPSSICRFIKSRANSNIISFKQLHLAGVRNLFEIKKTITERQQSSKTTSET